MTTERGVEYALRFLRRPDAGCATLFGALPCTWGTPWQRMQEHLRGTDPKYRQHMDELYNQFTKHIQNFVRLGREVVKKGGYIMFEWPAHNRLWREPPVAAMEREFKMQRVRFEGCSMCLTTLDGTKILKPWALSTKCPKVREKPAQYRCNGKHEHAKDLSGKDLRNTGFYTPALARLVHECIQASRLSIRKQGLVVPMVSA